MTVTQSINFLGVFLAFGSARAETGGSDFGPFPPAAELKYDPFPPEIIEASGTEI